MDPEINYTELYTNITAKLKKKLFRKPNFCEGSKDFLKLANQLREEECPEYAALHLINKSRCDYATGSTIEAANSLVCAAKQLIVAEHKLGQSAAITTDELVQLFSVCISMAIRIYTENQLKTFAFSTSLDLANTLMQFGHIGEAFGHFKELLLFSNRYESAHLFDSIHFSALFCLLKLKHYGDALVWTNDRQLEMLHHHLDESAVGLQSRDNLCKLEVYRVLLVLLLRLVPATPAYLKDKLVRGSHTQVLQEYMLEYEEYLEAAQLSTCKSKSSGEEAERTEEQQLEGALPPPATSNQRHHPFPVALLLSEHVYLLIQALLMEMVGGEREHLLGTFMTDGDDNDDGKGDDAVHVVDRIGENESDHDASETTAEKKEKRRRRTPAGMGVGVCEAEMQQHCRIEEACTQLQPHLDRDQRDLLLALRHELANPYSELC